MAVKRIVIPTNDKIHVESHFGHCKYFNIIDLNEEEIVLSDYVEAPEHKPGVIPKFIIGKNANLIITGNMGRKALDILNYQGVEVITGAIGKIEDNLAKYLQNGLESTGDVCNHHARNHTCNH